VERLPSLRVSVIRPTAENVTRPNTIILRPISWDDWFKYSTLYEASVIDRSGRHRELGRVKIAVQGMPRDQTHPLRVGTTYKEDISGIYSVGQSEEYYSLLGELGEDLRRAYTLRLGDLVAHPERSTKYGDSDVLYDSLLRYVSQSSLQGEFKRLLTGSTGLTKFSVKYRDDGLTIDFLVDPDSSPRTNIHAIIGRNGVGKTRLLQSIARSLLFDHSGPDLPSLQAFDEDGHDEGVFAGVAMLTFSPFETFMPAQTWFNRPGLSFTYIGLRYWKEHPPESGQYLIQYRTPRSLWTPFVEATGVIQAHERESLWQETLNFLRGDPIFDQVDFSALAGDDSKRKKAVFNALSDGHKTVLLAITMMAATIEERTLVIMDEPEAHLHPPLLSAFTRALSFLLRKRNAFAILATHSPVILQELPKQCVSLLDRDGSDVNCRQPDLETYGEDVATLTHEIFHLEVARSGYHRDLEKLSEEGLSYQEALDRLGGALGLEGRSILRSLCRENEN